MTGLSSIWPAAWSRQARSSATMALATALLLLILWLMAIPLSAAPEPIGNNAQYFAEGTRITVQLTLVAGLAGVLLGEVPEDVVLAISAAVAAYLGTRATVKQVRLRRQGVWGAHGRAGQHHSHSSVYTVR